jgi:hypothetical protein
VGIPLTTQFRRLDPAHRVVLDEVELAVTVAGVAGRVFPEPPLPHVGVAAFGAGGGAV